MPAIYAHYRFGHYVYEKLNKELKEIVKKHFSSFLNGLQGPDPLLYHLPYLPDEITETGDVIHKEPCIKFLKKAIIEVRKAGMDSGEYAYLIGFLCHFTFDSEVHYYVDEYALRNGVSHVFMETEFDKYILKREKKDPLRYDLSTCISCDKDSAKHMSVFYECLNEKKAYMVLKEMVMERKLLYTPHDLKYRTLLKIFGLSSSFRGFSDLLMRKDDEIRCAESNLYLYKKMMESIDLAILLILSLDDSIQNGTAIHSRFYRDFETLKEY